MFYFISLSSQNSKINSECIGWNTTAKNVGSFNIASNPTWAAPYNGYFCIQMWSTIGTPHDVSITCGGVAVAAGYLTYAYQRINAYLPLRKGTALAFTGNGDGVAISCMTGVFNP